jgi:DNA-binding ferritin-like protein (Dps family)
MKEYKSFNNSVSALPSDIRGVFESMEKRLQLVMDDVSGIISACVRSCIEYIVTIDR